MDVIMWSKTEALKENDMGYESEELYGFISKEHLLAMAKDCRYGSIYKTDRGKLVVCSEVRHNEKPFDKYEDNHHHGRVVKWVRSATYEDVKNLIGRGREVEDPAIYF